MTGLPSRALLVVDIQRDFCEGGSLGVEGGGGVARGVSAWIAAHGGEYRLIVASRDWHVDPGPHFAAPGTEPDFAITWPVHCVADTAGAAWHPDLALPPSAVVVSKGERAEAYSAFDGHDAADRSLADLLRAEGVEAVDVVGIATSYCVRATALDARRAGFTARVLTDLVADVDPAASPATLAELEAAGVALA
jgi:nicotinamidase/pyrazinamidase